MSACATKAPQTAWFDPNDLYPQELTSCAAEPLVPERPAPDQPRTEEDKATYTGDLRAAWANCRDTVASTADRKQRYQTQYDDAHRSGLGKVLHSLRK